MSFELSRAWQALKARDVGFATCVKEPSIEGRVLRNSITFSLNIHVIYCTNI